MKIEDFDFENASRDDYLLLFKYCILCFVWNYDYFTSDEKSIIIEFYNSCIPQFLGDHRI